MPKSPEQKKLNEGLEYPITKEEGFDRLVSCNNPDLETANMPDELLKGDKKSDLEEQIRELSDKNLSDDERDIIRAKVFNILESTDTVTHFTKINYLNDILQAGLFSVKLARNFFKRKGQNGRRYNAGTDTQEKYDNFDLISTTFNKHGKAKSLMLLPYSEESTFDVSSPNITLVYSLAEIEDKFKGVKIKAYDPIRREYGFPKRITLHNQSFVPGIWEDEYLANRKIENQYIKGIAVDSVLINMDISKILRAMITAQTVDQKKSYIKTEEQQKRDLKRRKNEIDEGIAQVLAMLDFLKSLDCELIGTESTGDGSIYKIHLRYKGVPLTITKEYGTIKMSDEAMKKEIADKVRSFITESEKSDEVQPSSNHDGFFNEVIDYPDRLLEVIKKRGAETDDLVVNAVFQDPSRFFKRLNDRYGITKIPKNTEELTELLRGCAYKDSGFDKSLQDFEYKMPEETVELVELVEDINKIVGNITLAELLKLVSKRLLIPIYSIDVKNGTSEALIP